MSVQAESYPYSEDPEGLELDFRILSPSPEEVADVRIAQSRAVIAILQWMAEERRKRGRGENTWAPETS